MKVNKDLTSNDTVAKPRGICLFFSHKSEKRLNSLSWEWGTLRSLDNRITIERIKMFKCSIFKEKCFSFMNYYAINKRQVKESQRQKEVSNWHDGAAKSIGTENSFNFLTFTLF